MGPTWVATEEHSLVMQAVEMDYQRLDIHGYNKTSTSQSEQYGGTITEWTELLSSAVVLLQQTFRFAAEIE